MRQDFCSFVLMRRSMPKYSLIAKTAATFALAVLCFVGGVNPAAAQSHLEPDQKRFGFYFKSLFTSKRKFCKIARVYTGLSAGQMVETSQGKGTVENFIVRKKVYYFYRYANGKQQEKKRVKKKIPAVKQIVVKVPDESDGGIFSSFKNNDSRASLKKVRLSEEETKKLMIKHLVLRGKIRWLLMLYPEEKRNLQKHIQRYAPTLPPEPNQVP